MRQFLCRRHRDIGIGHIVDYDMMCGYWGHLRRLQSFARILIRYLFIWRPRIILFFFKVRETNSYIFEN